MIVVVSLLMKLEIPHRRMYHSYLSIWQGMTVTMYY